MALMQVAHFNDFSDGLRQKLEERVRSFGKVVRYRFDIERENPDPTKYNGDKVFPATYTLDPARWAIQDNQETRQGKSKTKTVALIENVNEDGKPDRFGKIRVYDKDKGVLTLYIEERPEDFEKAMALELHPKNSTGLYPDKTKHQVLSRIDEQTLAKTEREQRSARKLAMDTAEKMSDAEIVEFADAMLWDSTEDVNVLRNKTEELAETEPQFFNDIIADKKTKFLSVIKKALDNKIIQYNPEDGKLSFAASGQPIVVLGKDAGIDGWGRYAEWFMTAGDKADAVYKKLNGMLKKQPELS